MPIHWDTEKINIQNYYKIIRRYTWLIGGYRVWKKVEKDWDIYVISVQKSGKYRKFYKHLRNAKTSDKMGWGITMPPTTNSKGKMLWFVIDSRNPFTIRQNATKGCHELAHIIVWVKLKNKRVKRLYKTPEGKKGSSGSAHTVIVHDVYYGSKEQFRFWISWAVGWIPITVLDIRKRLKKT